MATKHLLAIALIALAVALAALAYPLEGTEEITSIEPHFCPAEDCTAIFASEIRQAKDSVKCAFFDLTSKDVINALKDKKAKVEIDSKNANKAGALSPIRVRNKEGLMHNKFCVIDRKTVITGSFNPTGEYANDNNLIIINSKKIAYNYANEFKELKAGTGGGGRPTRQTIFMLSGKPVQNYFCPDDPCEKKVLEELRKARQSVYFMAYSFTSDAIGDYLVSRKDLDIKGVFDQSQINKWSEYKKMEGMDVLKNSGKNLMHHKVFIIDNSTVITGSYNPTSSASIRNDENLLIIADEATAQKYLQEFERVMAEAKL